MRLNDDGKTVAAMDVLVPKVRVGLKTAGRRAAHHVFAASHILHYRSLRSPRPPLAQCWSAS